MRSSRLVDWALAAGVLLCGGLIYLLARDERIFLNQLVLNDSAPGGYFARFRDWAGLADFFPSILLNSLPAGLWLSSFLMVTSLVWQGRPERGNIVWFLFPSALAIGSEFAQRFGLLPGVFDWHDISFYVLATVIFWARILYGGLRCD